MRLLITGALGFVGVNFVRRLASSTHRTHTTIIAADLHEPDDLILRFWAPVQDRVEAVRLDVTQGQDLLDLTEQEGVTHIVHCAAITPSLEAERMHPDRVSTVNLVGALNVLEATRRVDSVRRLLLMSSSGVYGTPNAQQNFQDSAAQIGEDGPLALDNLYAITKYSAELLAARYRVLCRKEMASIRLGPFYGPLERVSSSRPHLSIPGRLLAALQANRPATVAGPGITRDWIYADDAAAAVHGLLVAPCWRFDVYNLGGGRAISLGEMVDAFVDQGLHAAWIDSAERADIGMNHENGRQTMSVRRISDDSGWKPTPSPRAQVAAMWQRISD